MPQTYKRNYDRYTLEFKLQTVMLANHPNVMIKDVAEALGIHPVMLARWCMEHRRGQLKANKNMKPRKASPKRLPSSADPLAVKEDELQAALKKIQKLEKQLDTKSMELDLLKKAERFLAQRTKK